MNSMIIYQSESIYYFAHKDVEAVILDSLEWCRIFAFLKWLLLEELKLIGFALMTWSIISLF